MTKMMKRIFRAYPLLYRDSALHGLRVWLRGTLSNAQKELLFGSDAILGDDRAARVGKPRTPDRAGDARPPPACKTPADRANAKKGWEWPPTSAGRGGEEEEVVEEEDEQAPLLRRHRVRPSDDEAKGKGDEATAVPPPETAAVEEEVVAAPC